MDAYINTWKKYLPVIKLLMKKAIKEQQNFSLDRNDFTKSKSAVRVPCNFTIVFTKGRASNLVNNNKIAKDLAQVMLADAGILSLLAGCDYEMNMNTKFQMVIRSTSEVKPAPVEQEELAVDSND